jgi:hypothetical protein
MEDPSYPTEGSFAQSRAGFHNICVTWLTHANEWFSSDTKVQRFYARRRRNSAMRRVPSSMLSLVTG